MEGGLTAWEGMRLIVLSEPQRLMVLARCLISFFHVFCFSLLFSLWLCLSFCLSLGCLCVSHFCPFCLSSICSV